MTLINTYVPFASSAISIVFALIVLRRFVQRGGAHLLLWGIGMVFYAIGGFSEGYFGAFGWSDLVFRMWYLFGAVLVAAWLGQGTVYLLAKRRWANAFMILLFLGVVSAFLVFADFSIPVNKAACTPCPATSAMSTPSLLAPSWKKS